MLASLLYDHIIISKGNGKMEKNKVIELRTVARPVRVRDQNEIFAERRKKRKEKIDAVKNMFRNR
ncbi:hypothetical protein BKP35_16595 [Anaerobacillus arseniciselenatis]|uniref:Uncharacterized protein n=1 Tax=Anaerobacillus arseniciselenatis TaxID=85682 RepID=A0A1S2LBR2_9BACI|nr:hypothetical protein BKP35_16595 [Anaerobacillus arseniciselenatis]